MFPQHSVKIAVRAYLAPIVTSVWLLSWGGVPHLFGLDFAYQLKKAETGDAEAQFLVARSYDRGEDVPQDYAKAREMYAKAAAQGSAKAMNNLGFMYFHGRGVAADERAGFEWFKKAAENGADFAQFTLGVCYQEGRFVKRDVQVAVDWFQRAAAQGNLNAQRRLALIYYEGVEGVERDYAKAASVVKPLAESGDPWSMNTLASMLELGHGVPIDDGAALKWLRKAADAGDAKALFNLGSRYASGQGVERSTVEACALLEASLKKGEGTAQALLFQLSPTLTPAQAEEVKRQTEKILSVSKAHP